MTFCLDASVVLKLLVLEPCSERAREWLHSHEGDRLIAPTFMFAEVASVLQRKASTGEVTPLERSEALDILDSMNIIPVWDNDLIRRAISLADATKQPTVYDTIYLALAEREQCVYLTSDRKFAEAAARAYPLIQVL